MNIAYLILAHHQPSHLARLIKALSCDGVYFLVHVDLKTDISPFKELVPASKNIIFLENTARVKVYWGGYSIVMATLNLRKKNDPHSETVRYIHIYDSRFFNPRATPSKRLFSTTERVLRKIPRKRYQKIPLFQGAQWWALTDQCVRHILKFLKENSDYMAFHKHTRVPDETFFHSIIKSSLFAECIVHDV